MVITDFAVEEFGEAFDRVAWCFFDPIFQRIEAFVMFGLESIQPLMRAAKRFAMRWQHQNVFGKFGEQLVNRY